MLVDSSQGWLPLLPLEPQPGSDGELEPSHHSAWGGSPLPGTSCSIEALRESLHAVTPSASTLGATSPSAWSIRPARTGDLPAIKAIHDVCLPIAFPASLLLRAVLDPAFTLLVAQQHSSGRILAAALTRIDWQNCQVHLLSLCVDSLHRRSGVALSLLSHLASALQVRPSVPCPTVLLEVQTSNRAAIDLYRKLGFRIAAVMTNCYRSPSFGSTAAYRMIKVL